MKYAAVIGTLGDLYFRAVGDDKAALSVREVTKFAEQLGSIPADKAGQIEFMGQSIDTVQVLTESYQALGANRGPTSSIASLILNAAISYAGSEVEAHKLINSAKAGKIADADLMGWLLSIDPTIQHVSHDTVVDAIGALTSRLPWMTRKAWAIADRFLSGVLGAEESTDTQQASSEFNHDTQVIERVETRVTRYI
jgi:hypothetical protein